MTQKTKRSSQFVILIMTLVFAVPAVYAQEGGGISREALYNSADGFHVLIPDGWENQSTSDYAHFYQSEAQVSIYALSIPTTDVQAGIEQAVDRVQPDFEAEPITSEVMLSNGAWTQNIYLPVDDASNERITAYGQVYAGSTYVVLWYTNGIVTLAQPVIVPDEDVQAGIAAALGLLGEAPEDISSTEELTLDGATWTSNVYDSTASISVPFTTLGRVRGENTLVVANITGRTPFLALPVFFNLLTGFFLTPATAPYLYLGVGVTALIALIYIGTLVLRARNLRKDIETLETLEPDSRATA